MAIWRCVAEAHASGRSSLVAGAPQGQRSVERGRPGPALGVRRLPERARAGRAVNRTAHLSDAAAPANAAPSMLVDGYPITIVATFRTSTMPKDRRGQPVIAPSIESCTI
jgi:hypothetical protein